MNTVASVIPSRPLFLSFSNFFIQLFGELVVTDGIIAYASSYFTNTYTIDLPSYWTNRDKNIYLGAFFMFAFEGGYLFVYNAIYTCLIASSNSSVGDDGSLVFDVDDWVMQICPQPVSIREMLRVGLKFEEDWLNITNIDEG